MLLRNKKEKLLKKTKDKENNDDITNIVDNKLTSINENISISDKEKESELEKKQLLLKEKQIKRKQKETENILFYQRVSNIVLFGLFIYIIFFIYAMKSNGIDSWQKLRELMNK